MPRPSEFLGNSGQTTSEIYALTDGVTDDRFEAALNQAGDWAHRAQQRRPCLRVGAPLWVAGLRR